MPNTHSTLTGLFSDIADSIRAKTGDSSPIVADAFPTAISQIPTGITPSGTMSISANGTYDVTNYASAEVTVPSSPSGTSSITTNGTHDIAAYAYADVQVPNSYSAGDEGKVVQSGALVAQGSSSYTSNGTYDTTYIDSITVNVSGGGTATVIQDIDGNLVFPPTGDAVVLKPLFATANGTYTPPTGEGYSQVSVSGAQAPVRKEVNYYDFDGTLLYAYTATEFSELTAHPAEPTHTGLTSLGWNWDLSNAKTFVNKYGTLDLGMNYETDDNACRFYITLDSTHLTQTFGVDKNTASGLMFDWGDGSAPEAPSTSSGTFWYKSHTYAQAGSYVISVTFTSGKIGIGNGSILTTKSALKKVEFNSSVDFLGNSAFESCTELKTITLSNSITGWGGYIFKDCHSLQFVCMPKASGANMGWVNVWDNCYSLQEIVPGQSTTSGSNPSMNNTYSLIRFTELGTSQPSITNTYSLQEVVFTQNVSSVNFSNAYAMKLYNFRGLTSVPSGTITLNVSRDDCKIVVPDSLYSTWVAASNWSTYASKIVSASDYQGV